MIDNGIYAGLTEAKKRGEKRLAVLFDPDKFELPATRQAMLAAIEAKVDYFFIGGSLTVGNQLEALLATLRANCSIPLVLFPGNTLQLSQQADALLFLSLISGRNPELLIGQHVLAAPHLAKSPLEIISTGYILVDGGVRTSVQYMSNTQPIPADKNDIAVSTALAGVLLGLKMIYLEAGSGALNPVSESMISAVRDAIPAPLMVGGGIRTPEQAAAAWRAGADLVVVGNALERDPEMILKIRQQCA